MRVALAMAVLLSIAASPASRADAQPLATGDWGGEGVALTIAVDGSAVELDCAHGRIDGGFLVDEAGAFALTGWLVLEGGPVRHEEARKTALYQGTVQGAAMSLAITLEEGGAEVGRFELGRSRLARLRKCN